MDRNPDETARKMAEGAFRRLAAELETGRSEALTNYLAVMSRLRTQSWSNVLLIAAQRPDATRVAGFHTWNALGRAVKKGEKGIVIFAPVSGQQKASRSQASGKDDAFRPADSRAAYVFDVSQTEGKPLPESAPAKADVWKYGEQLRALVARRGIELQIDRGIEPARGVSSGGKIRLRPRLSPTEWVSVLTHELAHEMLHHGPEAAALSRDVIEAQANGVAYVVARSLGIETRTDIAEYMAEYAGDKTAVAQTLAAIQETSAQILNELLPETRASAARVAASGSQQPSQLDQEGFDQIHREYADRLIQSLTGFVKDRDRAEDLAARAFERAWEKREAFRGEASLRTWIEAIARNQAREDWSRARNVRFDSLDGTGARDWPAPELVTDELEKREDHRHLQQALVTIPIKHRRALVAHFVEGLSIRDIARRERVPEGTILSRIFTGKQLLREAWDAPITRPAAKATAPESPSPQLERQGSPGPGRTENERANASEPTTWDR